MDERKNMNILIGFSIFFLWIFIFPIFYYVYLVVDKIDASIRESMKISSDPLDSSELEVWIIGTIFSPIATVITLALIVGKLFSIFATLKTNSYIKFNKTYRGE